MDTNDIRTLKILEELDNDRAPSQRDLARSLGVSLGLVNSFIKRLVNKGYFKVTTIPKNRVRYILTTTGATEKTRLTYKYISSSYRLYRDACKRLRLLFDNLYAQGVRRVIIYGANDLAEIAYISLRQSDLEIVDIVDQDRYGKRFMGQIILPSEQIANLDFDKVLVASIDEWEIAQAILIRLGVPTEKILLVK